MGETPWDASSARREFTYADPLARILQQARASRDKSGGTKAVAQPNIFSVESANTFILNIISSRIFLMDVERLAKYMEENFDPDAGGKEIEKMRKELFLITQRSHNANQLAGAVLTKKELLDLKAIAGDRDIETIQKHCDQILYAAVRRNMRNLRKTYPDLTMDQIKGILDKMIAGGDKQ
ncbi:MAG: hypothetical protein CMN56_15255 [Sneathiella sp.]|nr:hypothetical protein [Sneathiella sp.]